MGLSAPALYAQSLDPPSKTEDEGMISRGFRMMIDGLFAQIDPTMEEMGQALEGLEPLMQDLATQLGDIRYYERPERLPNGDILIRRKADAPPVTQPPETDAPPTLPPSTAPQIDL